MEGRALCGYTEQMLRSSKGAAAILMMAGVATGTSTAWADTSLVATGEVTSGYSDNILGVAESDDPAAPTVAGDAFMDLAPGLALAHQRRRSTHNLTYTFGARLLLDNSEASSFSNTLAYQSVYSVSARTSVRAGAGFNSGRVNGFDQAGSDVVGQGDILPEGDVAFISYNANAAVRHLINSFWASEVSVATAYFEPTNTADVGPTTNAELRLRAERRYRYHLIGGELRNAFNKQEVPDLERSVTFSPGVFWTWNLTERVSTNMTAGLDIVREYPSFSRGIAEPRGSAALTYSHERGRATIGVARGVATNLFGGDTTVNTNYFLNFGLPVPIKRPTVAGLSFTYATGEIFDLAEGDVRGRTNRVGADFTLQTEINRAWRLGFRAETSRQQVTDIGVMGNFDAEIRVSTASFVLIGRFPENLAGQVPPRSSDRAESGGQGFAQPGTGTARGQGQASAAE